MATTAYSVSFSTVQNVISRAIRQGIHDRGRIERAATLLALGAVERVNEREYRVTSQYSRDAVYTVTPDGCDCEDRRRHPGQRCKHELATRILISAEMQEQRERFAALTDDELARLQDWKQKYQEAGAR